MAESGNPYWCQGESSGSAVASTSYAVPGAAMFCTLPSALTHDPGVTEWSKEEQATLERGLVEYDGHPPPLRYLNISKDLPNKTVREVALRVQWMEKRCGRRMKDQEGIQIPSTETMDITQELSLDETVLPGKELVQNEQIFAQVSSNHASLQIHENVQLFAIARDNINKNLDWSNRVSNLWERMAPMPVINENLLNFILRK
ncbi:uncharacterized protein [Elaeis guineensis]|uniref:Uncharacterized protein LOC105044375 isoform X2 n=1 Tax=Elaeis guineensis var. tenera TaxID=51953 RepID=A0A6J0PJY3_ELAGV|nr:uncharacterized protein LOC105044375 isoform X2 [Elaeis guineensis]